MSHDKLIRAVGFVPGEPLLKDNARNCYGYASIDEMIAAEYPEAVPVAPLVVGQWPIGPRYFNIRSNYRSDWLLAVWEE